MSREELLARAVVELADSLVDDFDIVDLLTTLSDRCVEVFDIEAAGIMLVDSAGALRVVTSSSEVMRVVELFELQAQAGPCLDAFRTGQPVVAQDLATNGSKWPRFATVAIEAGFRAADATPMRLRQQTIGALNLFRTESGSLDPDDLAVAQALADIATIAILQHRSSLETDVLNEQLNQALTSRILIEQAKGMIATRDGIEMEHAFTRLRNHARNHNRRLAELAEDLVRGQLDIAALDQTRP